MNEFFKNLKNEAQHTKLSHTEKQAMRLAVYEAIKVPRPVPRPAYRAVRSTTYVWFSPRFVLPVAVVLIMGLGTGTAFAAQGALPGDPLYPIKIHVNETVEVALATTPAAKAQAEADIADRRVVEAQTLAAQGRLDATTTQQLEDNFDEHASRALAFAGEEPVATTSAATSTAVSFTTSAATSTDTITAPQREGNGERLVPRFGASRFASTTPEATSSEIETPAASMQNTEGGLSASLQTQRNIFNELKQRAGKPGRGSDDTNNTDTQNSSQNNNHGGDDQDK